MRNFYVVVEGRRTEPALYSAWIRYNAPDLKKIDCPRSFNKNHFYILSGSGFPNYFKVIDNAIKDVNNNELIDYLVICVDSEEKTFEEKKREIEGHIFGKIDQNKVRIIIQHFCVETWALGNRRIFKRNPQDEILREYINFFNIHDEDPENLPGYPKYSFNRAQFAADYLRRVLKEQNPRLNYIKRNPEPLLHQTFYGRVVHRFNNTNHIRSFETFLNAFK